MSRHRDYIPHAHTITCSIERLDESIRLAQRELPLYLKKNRALLDKYQQLKDQGLPPHTALDRIYQDHPELARIPDVIL